MRLLAAMSTILGLLYLAVGFANGRLYAFPLSTAFFFIAVLALEIAERPKT